MSEAQVRQEVAKRIQHDEALLGHTLAQPRILQIRHAPAGTVQRVLYSDGSQHHGLSVEVDTDGWIVEAQGTFVGQDYTGANGIELHMTRAYFTFEDDGSGSFAGVPCWATSNAYDPLDGSCP